MNNPDFQRLRELAWRRRLTDAERAQWRAAHPEAAADLEVETALSDALAALPDAPARPHFSVASS